MLRTGPVHIAFEQGDTHLVMVEVVFDVDHVPALTGEGVEVGEVRKLEGKAAVLERLQYSYGRANRTAAVAGSCRY